MTKIDSKYIVQQYRSGLDSYRYMTTTVGLWKSEQYVIDKYFKKTDSIFDLGCGTGRTTFPLYQQGYQNIIGVDITPEMIDIANELNAHFNTNISFEVGDATGLKFTNAYFDAVIFSFNGLMSIPGAKNRSKAVQEITRVLKPTGLFIFTTYDREAETSFLDFWKEEKVRWEKGKQNPLLHDYGDIIAPSKNETSDIFIHIPSQQEVIQLLNNHNFKVLETFYRSDHFEENDNVRATSGECRFWVARKK